MKHNKIFLVLGLFIVVVTGCSNNEKKPKHHTVQFYNDHPVERANKIKECKVKSSISNNEQIECQNAVNSKLNHASKNNKPIIGDEQQVGAW